MYRLVVKSAPHYRLMLRSGEYLKLYFSGRQDKYTSFHIFATILDTYGYNLSYSAAGQGERHQLLWYLCCFGRQQQKQWWDAAVPCSIHNDNHTSKECSCWSNQWRVNPKPWDGLHLFNTRTFGFIQELSMKKLKHPTQSRAYLESGYQLNT